MLFHSQTEKPTDSNIGRTWNTRHGRAVITAIVSEAKPEYNITATYEYKTEDGSVFRIYERHLERTIERNEFDVTPEGIAKNKAWTDDCKIRQEEFANAKEKAISEDNLLNDRLKPFLESVELSAIRKGAANKALKVCVTHDGKTITRQEFIENVICDGYTKLEICEGNKIKPLSKLNHDRASITEPDDHEQKNRKYGKLSEYFLVNKDGRSYRVSAYEYAYANYLVNYPLT